MISRKQIVKKTLKEYRNNAYYLSQQSIDQLRVIQNSMNIEIYNQKDPALKFEMGKIAQQAGNEVESRRRKVFIKLEQDSSNLNNLNVVNQIKQSSEIISKEGILGALLSFFLGVLLFFKENQINYIVKIVLYGVVALLTVAFLYIIGQNLFCYKKLKQKQYQELHQAEEQLINKSEKRRRKK